MSFLSQFVLLGHVFFMWAVNAVSINHQTGWLINSTIKCKVDSSS